eukprot:1331802-Amorphochlora_amoeboformis.AAC.2
MLEALVSRIPQTSRVGVESEMSYERPMGETVGVLRVETMGVLRVEVNYQRAVGETVDGSIECKSKRGVSDLCNLSLTSPIWMRIIQLTNQAR